MTASNKQALREAAEKATALNLDTAQVKRGNDGYLECPCCEGAGYVEDENDFCNIDGVALGVQFYGIGEHHGLAELYLRAANPATVLALLDELEAAEMRNAELEVFISQSCYVFDGRDADISDAYIDASTSSLMPKVSTKDELFRYCSDGSCSCLPGGACEHCMGTGLDNPAAGIGVKGE
ncbi:ead/Ea22-like family protein [Salmonella enterica subsp. enterica]|nr:ead/Ea22-like family protein [Salmonella enterica subsp. enterica]